MHKYLNNVLLLTCILFPQTNIAQDKSITLEDVLAKVESTYDYENIRYDSLLNLTNHLIFDTNVLPKIDLSSKMPIMRNQFQWCHNMMDHIIIKVALMLHLNLYLTLNN